MKLYTKEEGLVLEGKPEYIRMCEKHFGDELLDEKEYQKFLNLNQEKPIIKTKEDEILSKELRQSVNELFFQFTKTSGSGKDPAEDELRKRRKKRR